MPPKIHSVGMITAVVIAGIIVYAFYTTGGDTTGSTIWSNIVLLVKQILTIVAWIITTIERLLEHFLGFNFADIGRWIGKGIVWIWNIFISFVVWMVRIIS